MTRGCICDCCGLCCRHLIVESNAVDVPREPRIEESCPLGKRTVSLSIIDACWILAGPGTPCPFLTPDNRCGIYATRPNTCVAFVAGSDKCQELRHEHGLPRLVPQPVANPMIAEIMETVIAEDSEVSNSS